MVCQDWTMKPYMAEEKLHDEEILIYYMYIKELPRPYPWECLAKLLTTASTASLRTVLALASDIEAPGCWDTDIPAAAAAMICEGRGRFISAYIVGDIGEEAWRGAGTGLPCPPIPGCPLYMAILKSWNLQINFLTLFEKNSIKDSLDPISQFSSILYFNLANIISLRIFQIVRYTSTREYLNAWFLRI